MPVIPILKILPIARYLLLLKLNRNKTLLLKSLHWYQPPQEFKELEGIDYTKPFKMTAIKRVRIMELLTNERFCAYLCSAPKEALDSRV